MHTSHKPYKERASSRFMEETQQLWVEKYRPKDFSDVVGQEHIVQRVKMMVEQKNLQNLLLAGFPGTGKTTLSILIAKKLFGEDWKNNFLDLNASDDRGIDVIRNQVKDFARTKAMGTNLPKIVHLDEADALTKEAQQALRRTMENYSQTARFILSANFSSNIIEPIQSRCAVFRFKPLENKDVAEVIKKIAKEEDLQVDGKTIEAVAEAAEGDLRKAVNILQSCASYDKKITEKHLYEIVSIASPKEVKEVLEIALKKDFLKARERLLEVMVNHGLSGTDVIKQIQKEIWNLDISDEAKLKLTEKCGEAEFRIVEGSDEFIQLEALLVGFVVAKK